MRDEDFLDDEIEEIDDELDESIDKNEDYTKKKRFGEDEYNAARD